MSFATYETLAITAILYIPVVLAQAPVSDLTGYPSGLASIAVIAYYAIQTEKDDLVKRRCLAGLAIEVLGRDLSAGTYEVRTRDSFIKGLTINRSATRFQRDAWSWRVCGREKGGRLGMKDYTDKAALIDGPKILQPCAKAFEDMPADVKAITAKTYGWGTAGHNVAALAAFCQIASAIPDAAIILPKCAAAKKDSKKMILQYNALKQVMDEPSSGVFMPDITGRSMAEMETLYVSAATWEDGGRSIEVPCHVFLSALGYCVDRSYGELLVASHIHLKNASWASSIMVQFKQPILIDANESTVSHEVEQAVRASRFNEQDCDLRLWFHRFGDHLASLVAGLLIAGLVSLGSTSGSWVACTAAAFSDPKPVAGYSSAAWGYPKGRRAHMEAISKATDGSASVCARRESLAQSFQPLLLHDITWQAIVALESIAILIFKFKIRQALGFGPFVPPAEWITRLCLAAATLGALIDIQLIPWAWKRGSKWSLAHAILMVSLEVATIVPRFIFLKHDSPWISAMKFWLADGCVWLHCILSGLFNMHLSKGTEYPVFGYTWPAAWLFAFASCGAGIPSGFPT